MDAGGLAFDAFRARLASALRHRLPSICAPLKPQLRLTDGSLHLVATGGFEHLRTVNYLPREGK